MEAPIILYGSPVLRKTSIDVVGGDNLQEIASSLLSTLKRARGIGLAAPQINLLKRIFVIDTTPISDEDSITEKFEGIFMNPVIVERGEEEIIYTEGCLSFPDIFEEVVRSEKILVRFQDLNFDTCESELNGIKSRIFQHELDHLDGILFIDRINILKRKLLTGKLNKIKRSAK
jgi:peptide deformylase